MFLAKIRRGGIFCLKDFFFGHILEYLLRIVYADVAFACRIFHHLAEVSGCIFPARDGLSGAFSAEDFEEHVGVKGIVYACQFSVLVCDIQARFVGMASEAVASACGSQIRNAALLSKCVVFVVVGDVVLSILPVVRRHIVI